MKYHVSGERLAYTGGQLHSNFAYTAFNILGDSIVAFCGPCDVKPEHMADIEDLKDSSRIYSENMLHFIVEHHDLDLEKGVLRQLLLVSICHEEINYLLGEQRIRRVHSDLYDGDSKLSISVATVTPISTIIHLGMNITSANTPVKTVGLEDYGIDPVGLATVIVEKYAQDVDKLHEARCKVRWVD